MRVSALTTGVYDKPLPSIRVTPKGLTNSVRIDREITQALFTDGTELRAERREAATELAERSTRRAGHADIEGVRHWSNAPNGTCSSPRA
jgi:hypothetical protein